MAGGHISEQAPARGIETARPSWWFLLYRHVLAHKWVAAGLALALLAVGGLLVQSAFQVFSGQAAAGAQPVEVLAAREELVHVGDVPGVEDESVARAVEDAVQRDGELNDSEIGSEVAANSSCIFEDGAANFVT